MSGKPKIASYTGVGGDGQLYRDVIHNSEHDDRIIYGIENQVFYQNEEIGEINQIMPQN